MHLKTIELLNLGPIENIKINCKFSKENTPIPLIIVGKNGSGKSLVTGRIMKHLLDCQSKFYHDSETLVDQSHIKAESSIIRHGSRYSKNTIEFEGIGKFFELILNDAHEKIPKVLDGLDPEFKSEILNEDKRYYNLSIVEEEMATEIFNKSTFLISLLIDLSIQTALICQVFDS